jgi:prefoldin subunit 5
MASLPILEEILEQNAVQVLKKELTKLENCSAALRKKLKHTKDRLDKVTSSLAFTKQQIDLFNQETHRALEGIKDTNWQFTKEACYELSKVKKPSKTLQDVATKFMLILDQKDRSWNTFKAVMRNFAPLKSLMSSVQPQFLTEEQMNELVSVWKNQQTIQYKLKKFCKGAGIIAEWISYSVEYKLKKETLFSVEQHYPEVKFMQLYKKKNHLIMKISDVNSQILTIEERIAEVKMNIEAAESMEGAKEEDLTDFSTYSDKSQKKPEERAVGATPLHQGTASGGILKHNIPLTPKFPRNFFPDFELNSEDLYQDAPKKKSTEEEVKTGFYEDFNESVGCCKLRFFCF